MTPQEAAESYRKYLEDNIQDAPENSKLVVHCSGHFAYKMNVINCLRMSHVGDNVIKSEW